MAFVLSEEQELLRQSAAALVRDHSSLKRIRQLRDTKDATGFSRELWKKMGELGWLGLIFAEEHGGAGMGYAELVVVLEECGKGLLPEPWLSTILLGGSLVARAGNAAQKAALLPGVIAGETILALAYQEPTSRYDAAHVTTRAEKTGSGWKLSGTKCLVHDGHIAERLIVSARTAGSEAAQSGITLFLVDAGSRGVTVSRQSVLDSRNAALIKLEGVTLGAEAVIGPVDQGFSILGEVLDRATVGLCAEMLGSMTTTFAMTLDYLKTRKQFGVPIGSFQALKHRAAKVYIESELSRSAVMAAATAVDTNDPKLAEVVSVAKARLSDTFMLVANESVQMHGGIGMTDEHDIGFFIKRARTAELTFGDAAFHRDRFASLQSY